MAEIKLHEMISARCREARTRNGWTQAKIEEWGKLASGMVAQIEGGRMPSVQNLAKLSTGLRTSMDWLCGHDPEGMGAVDADVVARNQHDA
jgi:transcriptional regulator with XRE-family HTH domain